jgi:D-alanyl-D-alanine carboxypeptidase (penicillin-binding protein 5/6)
VKAHKLSSMTITDPSGIEPTDAANATDLLTRGKLALANPVIAQIVATKSVTIHDVGTLTNTNALLGSDGIDGIKTGTLDGAGANLLFATTHQVGTATVTIVGVVLGGANHTIVDSDIRTLLSGVFAGFHQLTLVKKGDVYARYSTGWGQTSTAIAQQSARVVTWSDAAVTSTSSAKPITTGTTGDVVGTATFTVAGRTIRVPLGLARSVTDPGIGWRLAHPGLVFGAP